MLHSYYLKAFRHHGQKAVKQLCEKEINEEINGAIMSFNRSFNVHKDKGVFLNDKMFDKKSSCDYFFYMLIF